MIKLIKRGPYTSIYLLTDNKWSLVPNAKQLLRIISLAKMIDYKHSFNCETVYYRLEE